jgi:enterochelin esterase family protein
MDIATYQRFGLHRPFGTNDFWGEEVNGRTNKDLHGATDVPGDRQYNPCAEAYPQGDIPSGTLTAFSAWKSCRYFPETVRDMWVYTPYRFNPADSAPAVMVFQDGEWYCNPHGAVRATKVFDALIDAGDMPATIAVFLMPGKPIEFDSQSVLSEDDQAHRQRSLEYDSCTEVYGQFLCDEVLPFVEQHIGGRLTDDPTWRTLCGVSSGGICAFNAAWHWPEKFGRVLSHCGSFVNIRGGHHYPYLVRSTPRKPIRVFLQSGRADANCVSGHWPLANQQMAAALDYAGYDAKFVYGEGGHSLRHGGAIFADSLRWLWRE